MCTRYRKTIWGWNDIKSGFYSNSSPDDDLRVSLRKTLGDDALSEEAMLEIFFNVMLESISLPKSLFLLNIRI
jgi:hypothetical protein